MSKQYDQLKQARDRAHTEAFLRRGIVLGLQSALSAIACAPVGEAPSVSIGRAIAKQEAALEKARDAEREAEAALHRYNLESLHHAELGERLFQLAGVGR